jgi:hypothetical protein
MRLVYVLAVGAAFGVLCLPADGHAQENALTHEASQPAAATNVKAPQSPADSERYWSGEWAAGERDGSRIMLRDKGLALTIRLTQGYQGVTAGARANQGEYGGKFLTDFSFDFTRLIGWQGLSAQVLTETRFGAIPNVVGVKVQPTTYLLTPKSSGTVFAITGLNLTQLVPLKKKGDFIAVGAGRYMGFDGADSPFNGGGGHTTFLHLAFNGTPTNGRLVPSVTNGANLAWIRQGQPFLTFAVRDAVGHPTTPGITDMFEDGATFISGISVPTRFFEKSGKQSVTWMITSREFTPFFDGPGEIGPVEPPLELVPEAGSWVVQYKMYQYFSERQAADGSTRGWGMFATLAAADGRTNKSGAVLTLGVGGRAPTEIRAHDRWGVAYTQDGVSFKYREQARPVNLSNEKVFEAFYGFAVTRFVLLTADLQVIRPMLQGSETAVLPGVRLVIDF